MSLALTLACLWVLAATALAVLPMRAQFVPGALLLAVAPVLVGLVALEHGALIGLAVLAAVISIFRRPLGHGLRSLWARIAGRG